MMLFTNVKLYIIILVIICGLSILVSEINAEKPEGLSEQDYYTLIDDVVAKNNYYEILQVDRNAKKRQIRKAFREVAKTMHPDQLRNLGAKERKEAEEKYIVVNRAVEMLSNPIARSTYDHFLDNGVPLLERYYNRYAFKVGAPRASLRVVIVALVLICTVLQYLYKLHRYHKIMGLAKNTQRYKTAQKKREWELRQKGQRVISEADLQPEIEITGLEKPAIIDLLPATIFFLPYHFVNIFVVKIFPPPQLSQDEMLMQANGWTKEELEVEKQKQMERIQKMKSSAKYKRYMRAVKSGKLGGCC